MCDSSSRLRHPRFRHMVSLSQQVQVAPWQISKYMAVLSGVECAFEVLLGAVENPWANKRGAKGE